MYQKLSFDGWNGLNVSLLNVQNDSKLTSVQLYDLASNALLNLVLQQIWILLQFFCDERMNGIAQYVQI